MITTNAQYEVERFGPVVLGVVTCQRCGYRHSDVITLSKREPVALRARINSIDDLKIRVIKSGTAIVSIPELGATITPGPYSEGFISNVEGVLQRIEDALTFMLSSAKGKCQEKAERMLKQVKMARESNPHFTFVIKDPLGNSALVSPDPSKVRKRKLTERELLKVKFGEYALMPDMAKP